MAAPASRAGWGPFRPPPRGARRGRGCGASPSRAPSPRPCGGWCSRPSGGGPPSAPVTKGGRRRGGKPNQIKYY
eukprot:2683125-Pyramimonas_sp.AAC.1